MRHLLAAALLCAGLSFAPHVAASAPAPAGGAVTPEFRVLSNRSDLISGGDALVELVLPAGVDPARVRVRLNRGPFVTDAFARRADGRVMGLVTGLRNGRNLLVATLPGGTQARAEIWNHPNGGPVIAGPQPQPWRCQAGALDAQCNQPATYAFWYISTDSQKDGFQPYDPAQPPADVANVRTQNGLLLPFIVRVETGYQDRDQYRIAMLFQPGQPWDAFAPQPQFNRKLLVTHGASCDVDYATAGAPSVLSYNPADLLGLPVSLPYTPFADSVRYALGEGYAVMSTALDNSGHNCNLAIQAESLIMAKEHLVEAYGELRYTIGTGCSGGSLAVQWIANAYPGVYQGILPTCSFPDTWTSATQVMDYHLLRLYFEDPSAWGEGVVWTPDQWADVEGHGLPVNAIVSDIGFFNAIVPTHDCGGIDDATRYHPDTNPGGVRCSIADFAINVFGPRDPSVWTPNEVALGRGFAGIAVDNTGVQYGLSSLRSLRITPAQFVDLNAKVGGLDIDIRRTAERISADPFALRNAYRSGMINEANNLDQTAIIDCRGPDPGAAHDSYRAYAMRARLDREHGSHGNHVIWEGPAPIVGDTQCSQTSLVAMDRWLANVEADASDRPLADKLILDRPGSVGDQCWNGLGTKLTNRLCGQAIVPVYGTPRMVAGDRITTDANKCQLGPLDRSNPAYGIVPFTDEQWATLQATFPDGVCNFDLPGVSQRGTVPWMTYQSRGGFVIYGGRRLPPVPENSGGGWSSPSFR